MSVVNAQNFLEFKKDAIEMANREVLLAPFLSQTIILTSSFAESIANMLANHFAGLFPYATWIAVLLPVFRGDFGNYESDINVIAMLEEDLKVSS